MTESVRASERGFPLARAVIIPAEESSAKLRLGGVLDAVRKSVWAPILIKLVLLGTVLMVLAGVGAWSLAKSRVQRVELATIMTKSMSEPFLALPPPSAAPPASAAAAPERMHDPKENEGSGGVTADGRVILNRAGPADLVRLPGVGQRRAEAILRLRERLGRFRRIHDLLRVRGIGPRSLQRMKPHLVLDPPPAEADAG